MKKTAVIAIMILTAAGMAQAAVWQDATGLWHDTTSWDTGNVPDGVGEFALVDKAPNPDLGGTTVTLGSSTDKWSLRTGGTTRVFNNGAIKIERTSTATLQAGGDISLNAAVSSFNVPIELSRTSDSASYLRIALLGPASKGAFNNPITWSNQQLDFYNESTTDLQSIFVNSTVTGSSANRDIRAISYTAGSTITFRGVIGATVSDVDFQIAAGDGTIVFNNLSGVVVDSSLGEFRLAASTIQTRADDQIATDMGLIGAGATWDLYGNNNKNTGTLRFNNDGSFDFSHENAEALWFEDSSAMAWGGDDTLDLVGFVFGTDELRFGTDANGLTSTQLGLITVDGSSVSGLALDSGGYLIPEPATIGLLGLASAMLLIARRLRI